VPWNLERAHLDLRELRIGEHSMVSSLQLEWIAGIRMGHSARFFDDSSLRRLEWWGGSENRVLKCNTRQNLQVREPARNLCTFWAKPYALGQAPSIAAICPRQL
jgi:hypothetical protein